MRIPSEPDHPLTIEQIKFLRQSWSAVNYLLSEMLSEIRTPTSAIIGWSGLMLEEKLGLLNEEQRQELSNIHKSGHFLLAVWDDLFVMHQVLFDYLNLHIEEVNLYELIQQAIAATWEHWLISFHPDRPTIKQHLPDELPTIWADRLRIQQAITRILLEAISTTYSREKSQIGMVVSHDDAWVTIQVRVTGAEVQYFRDHNSPRLFFSRMVSEMHSGQVQLEQQEAELVFTLTLPIYQDRSVSANN